MHTEQHDDIGQNTSVDLQYEEGSLTATLETKFDRADATRNIQLGHGFLAYAF
jgi:hypothetical protein